MAFGGTGFSLCDALIQENKSAQAEACATSGHGLFFRLILARFGKVSRSYEN
jgi:hypothetical protein